MGQSSGSSDDREGVATAGGVPGSGLDYGGANPYRLDGVSAGTATAYTDGSAGTRESYFGQGEGVGTTPYRTEPEQPQQQSFLGEQPAEAYAAPPAEVTKSDEWVASAAGALAGAGVVGAAAVGYDQYEQRQEPVPAESAQAVEAPESYPVVDNTAVADYGSSTIQPTAGVVQPTAESSSIAGTTILPSRSAESTTDTMAATSPPLGGLEAEGARETGAFFPRVVRHGTDMSISQLHVPGEYPKRD